MFKAQKCVLYFKQLLRLYSLDDVKESVCGIKAESLKSAKLTWYSVTLRKKLNNKVI